MAYIPGLDHDVFMSYAHEDVKWVKALQEQLEERLTHRLVGGKADVWQDINKIRTGQDFPSELEKAVRVSATFIAVLSRNYQGSEYCERELDAFLKEVEKTGGLETGEYGRSPGINTWISLIALRKRERSASSKRQRRHFETPPTHSAITLSSSSTPSCAAG